MRQPSTVRPAADHPAAEIAIRTRGLSKDFGHRAVLRHIDLDVRAGESILLRGANGAGKTTLLRCLASSVRPSAGELWWFGQRVTGNPTQRRQIGMVAHESRLYPQLSLRENLLFAARIYGLDRPGERADYLLQEMAMAEHAERRPGQVSRGMRQRVSVAMALVHRPQIVLLDEPFSSLDTDGRRWLRRRLAQLRGERRTWVIVTHEETVVKDLVDRVLELNASRLSVANDPARQLAA